MNADGSDQVRLTNSAAVDSAPAWSPDGRKITFQSNRDGNFEIYVMDQNGANPMRLTNNLSVDLSPAWSPDGTRIAFSSDRDGNSEIYIMNADGSAQTNLSNNVATDQLPAFSPNGTKIAFVSDRDVWTQIYVMNVDGSNLARLTVSSAVDSAPAWSPDGRLVAFQSTRSGNQEIYRIQADSMFEHNLTINGATDTAPDWQPAPLGCLPAVIRGNIGQGSPDYPSASGIQNRRLSQHGGDSSCGEQKRTPPVVGGQSFAYDAYQFANDSDATACVTFDFGLSCGANQAIRPVAYLGSYDPSSPAANYRGDLSPSINAASEGSFSVNIPAYATVTLVVHEIGAVDGCPNYNFTVTGLPCPVKLLSIERPTNGHILLQGLRRSECIAFSRVFR